MEKEIRSIECRAVENSRTVEGYALVFNSLSKILQTVNGSFYEKISPDSLGDVVMRSDVMALLNHNDSRGILARSRFGKGSLSLEIDEVGLKYRFEAPKTALGDELLEYLRRNDITSSSFAFTVSEDIWEKQTDGTYIRTITKFDKLFDVSPVFEPAYDSTSVKCVRFAEIQEEERLANERLMKEAEERAAQEEAEKQAKLEEYYNELKNNNKEYLPD